MEHLDVSRNYDNDLCQTYCQGIRKRDPKREAQGCFVSLIVVARQNYLLLRFIDKSM